ncbi:relaxase/mobilization nuclease domain-containing protein [Pseudorhodobacter sp.]|uniref:relaxase/mobilization nuclease domain-containing protein n=1 Tax=Pseudorhodobacter sp. TaxID=1934400 RepID=UPI0026499D3D|nr:relaxase/mobilization nuclease domain-containing protein [Pseudorhodobacter sp.]MDN5787463.1 relaxase/mobilization nuclease domain-containing protein [Pseudorhodobacter sp.]
MSKHDPLALYHAVMGEAWAEDDLKAKGGRARAAERQARSFKRAGQPSVRNIIKAAKGSRAAVFKRIRNGGCKTLSSLGNQLDYVNDKAVFTYSNQINSLEAGDRLSEDQKAAIMEQWSGTWRGTSKLGFTSHMLLSFPKEVSAEQVQGIALDWCEHFFESGHYGDKWDYMIAVHTDRDHPHAHILLNNRGSVMGEWFACWAKGNMSPQLMREKQAEIAEGYGVALHATTRLERGLTDKPAGLEEIYAAKAEDRRPMGTALSEPEAERARAAIVGFVEEYTDIADLLESIDKSELAEAVRLMRLRLSSGIAWNVEQGEMDMGEIKTVGEAIEFAEAQIDGIRGRAEELIGVERAEFEAKAAPVLAEFYQMVPDPERREAYNQELVEIYPPGAGAVDLADRFVDAAQRETLAQVLQAGQDLGLDTEDVLARMKTGGTKNHGLAQDWINRDLRAILAKEGIELDQSSAQEFDAALEKLGGFQTRLGTALGIEMESPFDIVATAQRDAGLQTEMGQDMETQDGKTIAEAEREQAILQGIKEEVSRLRGQGYSKAYISERSFDIEETVVAQIEIAQQTELVLTDLKNGVAAQFDNEPDAYTVFEPVIVSLEMFENPDNRASRGIYLEELTTGLNDLIAERDAGNLSQDQLTKADILIAAVLDRHFDDMIRAVEIEYEEPHYGEARIERLKEIAASFGNKVSEADLEDVETPNAYIRQLAENLRDGDMTEEQTDTIQRALVSELHHELGDEGMADLDRGNWDVLEGVLPAKVDQISVTQKYLEITAEERGDADLADLAGDLHQERARARAEELILEHKTDPGLDDDLSL